MAEKKALIVLAPAAELGAGTSIEKLLKKGALFSSYAAGTVVENDVLAEAAKELQPQDIAAAIEEGIALGVVNLSTANTAALDAALALILDGADRKTVIAVVAQNGLVLHGTGINGKAGSIARPAAAKDIVPTLAYITDFAITQACTGAILYQALKSPNMKLDETTKLKEAIIRMEGALARDNREPWDKHDCA